MNAFNNILEKKILNVQRLDTKVDYEFYSPYAIILIIDGRDERLIISTKNDGSSVDIRMISEEEIVSDYGLEFGEHTLNNLKVDDELNLFIGDKLQEIRTAEYIYSEIKGNDFVVQQGKYSGVRLKTERHELLFRNNNGGWCDIDDKDIELTKKDRWEWT